MPSPSTPIGILCSSISDVICIEVFISCSVAFIPLSVPTIELVFMLAFGDDVVSEKNAPSFTEEFIFERGEDVERLTTFAVVAEVVILYVAFDISSTDSSPTDIIELTEIEDGFISETDSRILADSVDVIVETVVLDIDAISVITSVTETVFDVALA
jgi:hypothetical protein